MIRPSRILSYARVLLLAALVIPGCDGFTLPPIDDILNGNANENQNDNGNGEPTADRVELSIYATNTNGASALAVRPSDGALFAVNSDGLFGPIGENADLSAMTPFGATNLADPDLFDEPQSSFALAITEDGTFWIASQCCVTMALVAPEGGDAVPFQGLFGASEIKPETLAIVPEGFVGPQIQPGQILVGQETTFSRLVAINAQSDRSVLDIENPTLATETPLNREAHFLVFGQDGNLYSSQGATGLTEFGLQRIGPDGTPTQLPGALGAAADCFIVLESGDMILRGALQTSPTSSTRGILLYLAAEEEIVVGTSLPAEEIDEADDMLLTADGSTIFLSLTKRDEIVRVRQMEQE